MPEIIKKGTSEEKTRTMSNRIMMRVVVAILFFYLPCTEGQKDPGLPEETHPAPEEDDNVGADYTTMKTLYNTVLNGYDTRIRPIVDQSKPVAVNTRFIPQSLIAFDTAEQKFSILGYFRIYWTDEELKWIATDYGNTTYALIPVYEIWTPSLIIKKAYDGNGLVGNQHADIAKISSAGSVQWVPEGIYSVVCNVDIRYYPFDEQSCTITYYVSDETVVTVVLDHKDEVDLSEYSENSGWSITEVERTKETKYNTVYVSIHFNLRRRASFATFTLITPLLMLAFLNICIFLVPIGSGEKGSFAITIFLSYGIFVTIVSDTLPHNSLQISYFVLFITILLFMSVISVFYTIIQAKLLSSIGDKECTIRCCRTNRASDNQVVPLKGEDGFEGTNQENYEPDEPFTWNMFMEKLDNYLFIGFFVIIALLTCVFFSLLLRHVTLDMINGDDSGSNSTAYK